MLRLARTAFVDIGGDLYCGVGVVHIVLEVWVVHKLQLQGHLSFNLITVLQTEAASDRNQHT